MDQTIQDQSNNSPPQAGKAGRPKGSRNRVSREVKEIALRKGPKMLRLLESLAEKAKDERTQLAAVTEYLNRAYGKPISPTEISGPDGAPLSPSFNDISPIEQRSIARNIAFVLARAAKDTPPAEPEALPDPAPLPTTWYNATTPPDPKPAQVIPPEPNGYHYEPTPEETARREFDAHTTRLSERAISFGGSRPNVITQRPR